MRIEGDERRQPQQVRCVHDRRELPKRAQKARRKPQIATVDGLTGRPGELEACLMRPTDASSVFGSWQTGNLRLEVGIRETRRQEKLDVQQ
jgi:hypothetical protein